MLITDKPTPEWCDYCNSDGQTPRHWKWGKAPKATGGGYWSCRVRINDNNRRYRLARMQNPDLHEEFKAKLREYYRKKPLERKHAAYIQQDRQKGRLGGTPIPWEEARPLMQSGCNYCEIESAGGLDRIDNNSGHVVGNVVPACSDCNFILSDMPIELKLVFKPALMEARNRGLLDIWKHPKMRSILARQGN